METFLLFILLIIILIVILNLRSSLKDDVNSLNKRLDGLSNKLNSLSDVLSKLKSQAEIKPEETKPAKTFGEIIHAEKEEKIILPAETEKIIKAKEKEPAPEPVKEPEVIRIPEVITYKAPEPIIPKVQQPPEPGFFERNPDLEKFIGENLANKIGIAILVLGIGFFVKYAIDKEWIGIYGRVFIGLLCGGILIALAHRLRNSFAAFSSVLVGGGIAVLYFTIYISFHAYAIMSQQVAFGIMVVITGFTILLSLAYNRIELAILAILGGFGSPFMVSTGEGNYIVLFTYIMILDLGMLVLAFFKNWRPINIIAYAFTLLLFGSWLAMRFNPEDVSMIRGGLIFATLFFLTFFVMNIINNVKKRVPFEATEFMLLLSNTFLYYAAGMNLLDNPDGESFKGLFTAFVGVFNFVFAFSLYKKSNVDRNLIFLLIGLVLTFISLAAPVQLKGNYITLFWSAEAVLLLWLSLKSGIRLIKLASVIVMVLMWISLAMDWYNVYSIEAANTSLSLILNKGYITSIVSVISMLLYYRLLKNDTVEPREQIDVARMVLTSGVVVVLYICNLLELTYHLNVFVDDAPARSVIIGLYNMFFIFVVMIAEPKMVIPPALRQASGLLGLLGIASFFVIYHQEIILTRNHFLNGTSTALGFIFHYPFIILLIAISALSLRKIRSWKKFNDDTHNLYSWFFVFFFLFLASAELDHTVLLSSGAANENLDHILRQNHKIGYPILWGITSFLLIVIGLKRKLKHLRIISLSLFLVTLLKLFIVDIRGISEGGKIAAFISLGILLLIVSFMYQRLKKILLSDEKTEQIKDPV